MTKAVPVQIKDLNLDAISEMQGSVAVLASQDGKLDKAGLRVNKLMKQVLKRFLESDDFEAMKLGTVAVLSAPLGMIAQKVYVMKHGKKSSVHELRKLGANLAKVSDRKKMHLVATSQKHLSEIALGFSLRLYEFTNHKTAESETHQGFNLYCVNPDKEKEAFAPLDAQAQGVFFTRDLVNEPANFLTTENFADQLTELSKLGLKVSVLEEKDMEKLSMGSLLSVGHGSDSPSKTVIMEWNGGGDERPLALVGKGVVFDTGGISLKPAAGMEDMTMDMGGAGVVSGVMKTLALRKARANVVGLVGLVENMPDARATRPGDVVKSMKGDTIEVINTDAEGRLVLADVLWYAQKTFEPTGIIDLATLTGAIIIGLGHENAGVFSNDDAFCNRFLEAAKLEVEGAWRMPLGQSYDNLLKSRIADMKNIGGRAAGSVTAAQFLQRFIEKETPWIHLDIAGVASVKSDTDLSPKGATGWGVRALDRLVKENYEA